MRSSWAYKMDPMGSENVKKGINPWEVPYHLQVWECPPPSPPGIHTLHGFVLQ